MERIKEAIELCLEVEHQEDINISDFVGVQRISIEILTKFQELREKK